MSDPDFHAVARAELCAGGSRIRVDPECGIGIVLQCDRIGQYFCGLLFVLSNVDGRIYLDLCHHLLCTIASDFFKHVGHSL